MKQHTACPKIFCLDMCQRSLVLCFLNPGLTGCPLTVSLVNMPWISNLTDHIAEVIVLLHLKQGGWLCRISRFLSADCNKEPSRGPCRTFMKKATLFPTCLSRNRLPGLPGQKSSQPLELHLDPEDQAGHRQKIRCRP